jgi:carbon-monoxide dehydrogenase iron sulfur subunit
MKAKGRSIYVELERCMACRGCEIACALEHSESKDLFAAVREEPRPVSRVSLECVDGTAIPLQCRHCEDAPCVTVCPTQALHRIGEGQPVLIDDERCIGCKMCIMVCPFGVITLREGGKVALKCDLCLHRIEADEMPACVAACPTGALQFPTIEEITRLKREAAARSMKEAATASKEQR